MNNDLNNREYVDLFRAHDDFLVRVAFRFAPRPDLVPDIVHQAFIRFMERAEKKPWNMEIETKPLLYTITKSVALDYWRRYQRENANALVRIGERLRRIQADNKHKEAVYEHGTTQIEALRVCLKTLPSNSIALLEEHYDHGIPINEIARKKQIAAARLRKVFSRLRSKLKDCIRKTLYEQDD